MIDKNAVFESVRLAHENAATMARMAQRQTELTAQLAAARRRADVAEVLAVVPLVYLAFRAMYAAAKHKPKATPPKPTVPPRADGERVTVDDVRDAFLAELRRELAAMEAKGA